MKLPPRCGKRFLSLVLGAAPSVADFEGSIGATIGGGAVRIVAMLKAWVSGIVKATALLGRAERQGRQRSSFICAFSLLARDVSCASSSADGGSRQSGASYPGLFTKGEIGKYSSSPSRRYAEVTRISPGSPICRGSSQRSYASGARRTAIRS